MNYIYIDGDNIGLKIEQSFLNNREGELTEVNFQVTNAIINITSYLMTLKHEVLFSGADGIISKGEELDVVELLKIVREVEPNLTFSLGIGKSLRDAYVALRYAKSNGKNMAVGLFENSFYDYEVI